MQSVLLTHRVLCMGVCPPDDRGRTAIRGSPVDAQWLAVRVDPAGRWSVEAEGLDRARILPEHLVKNAGMSDGKPAIIEPEMAWERSNEGKNC